MVSKITFGQLKRHKPWRTRGNKWKNEAQKGFLKWHPDEPIDRFPNQSTAWSMVNAINALIFVHFLVSWSSPYHFQLKSPIFYVQCQGNFDFWSKFDHFPKCISIWCIWYEIHAIIMYIQQEFIKQSFDHKEITPNCLLISTNCSSLRGFVIYRQVDILCLQIQV